MDIQHLVDRLEQVLSESRRLPLTALLLVDEDQIFNVVDQIRVAIPEEVKRASRIEAEKERILAQAKEEADRIRQLARQEAAELVRRENIKLIAEREAQTTLDRAEREAEILRVDADSYVLEVLTRLEEELVHSITVVRNGLQRVQVDQTPVKTPLQREAQPQLR